MRDSHPRHPEVPAGIKWTEIDGAWVLVASDGALLRRVIEIDGTWWEESDYDGGIGSGFKSAALARADADRRAGRK